MSTHMINGRIIIFEAYEDADTKANALDTIEDLGDTWPGTDGHVLRIGRWGTEWVAIERGRLVA